MTRRAEPGDPLLRDYTDLTDVQLRGPREVAEGVFMAEGANVVARALREGYRPRSMLVLEARLERDDVRAVVAAMEAADAPVLVGDSDTLAGISGFVVHRGVLAAFDRRPLPEVAELVAGAATVVALEGVVDHTNVGAIARSAAGLGVDALLLDPRCADPLYRRAVRTSMGATLRLPFARSTDWRADLELLRHLGFTTLALTPAADAVDLADVAVRRPERVALLLGEEGPGLERSTLAGADLRVRIPMSDGIDSLNVAAAAAVACWALRVPR